MKMDGIGGSPGRSNPKASKIETFVFLDFESSGLHGTRPRITELSLVALNRDALLEKGNQGHMRRVLDKLTIGVYPSKGIPPQVTDITGLDNDNLQYKQIFDEDMADLICLFLKRQYPPICLVAHNGKGFDFGLLQNELLSIGKTLPEGVWCVDSLDYFRGLDGFPALYLWAPLNSQKRAFDGQQNKFSMLNHQESCSPSRPSGDCTSGRNELLSVESSNPNETKCLSQQYTPNGHPKKGLAKFHKNSAKGGVKRKLFPCEGNASNDLSEKNEIFSEVTQNSKGDSFNLLPSMAFEVKSISTLPPCKCQRSQTLDQACQTENMEENALRTKPMIISSSSDTTPNNSQGSLYPWSPSWSSVVSVDSELEEELQAESSQGNSQQENDEATLDYYIAEDSEVSPPPKCSSVEYISINWEHFAGENELDDSEILNIECINETSSNEIESKNPPHTACATSHSNTKMLPSTPKMDKVANAANSSEMKTPVCTGPPPCKRGRLSPTKQHGVFKNPEAEKCGKLPHSHRQRDIHFRLFGAFPSQEHRAEDDCLALARIFNETAPDILLWCDKEAVLFSEVVPLYSVRQRDLLGGDFFPCDHN